MIILVLLKFIKNEASIQEIIVGFLNTRLINEDRGCAEQIFGN